MKQGDFESKLAMSREAEMSVSAWLQNRGWSIIPSYDYSGADGDKAPKLRGRPGNFPVPDLDASRDGRRLWVEVKCYTRPVLNRRFGCYVHGIPKRLYDSYAEVERITGSPVYLAVEEVQGARLLIARLSELKVLPCLCGCKGTGICKAPNSGAIQNGVYFDVAQFLEFRSSGPHGGPQGARL